MSGKGHPLPGSDEARHDEIPESAAEEKGRGDDSRPLVQPQEPVTPDGERYRYDVAREGHVSQSSAESGGRGDPSNGPGRGAGDDLKADQAAHQDRGQGIAEAESGDGG